jgi:hypothetical protein
VVDHEGRNSGEEPTTDSIAMAEPTTIPEGINKLIQKAGEDVAPSNPAGLLRGVYTWHAGMCTGQVPPG